MIPTKDIVVQGWDVSSNHSGMVELTGGEMTDYFFVTLLKGDAKAGGEHGVRLDLEKMKRESGKEPHVWGMRRLEENAGHFRAWAKKRPHYVGIEDYALGSKRDAQQAGETGGLARHILWKAGIPFRLHDPKTIKMFVCLDGNAGKAEMELNVIERWGVDFGQYNTGTGSATSEDLADAFGAAQMIWTEVLLRRGEISLKSLHEKEIQVFNRVTKAYPVALLSREWIQRTDVKTNHVPRRNNKRKPRGKR